VEPVDKMKQADIVDSVIPIRQTVAQFNVTHVLVSLCIWLNVISFCNVPSFLVKDLWSTDIKNQRKAAAEHLQD
jgi:hypothetical protein